MLHDDPSIACRQENEISPEEISALLRDARLGNAESFARLLEIYEGRLHRHALFLARDEQHALDLLQETVLAAWKHLARYNDRATLFTWMCSIMLHRHYDWLRRMRTRAFLLFGDGPSEEIPEENTNPSEHMADAEDAKVLRSCLDRLPPRQRDVVYLRFYAGESLEGIGAILGCPVGTVKSRLFHGLKRLAEMPKLKELRIEG